MKKFFLILSLMATQTLCSLGYVNDYAHLYSPSYKEQLENTLVKIASEGGPEIAILTLQSLEGSPIETVARTTFDAWGIGKKEKDNGLLLIIAMKEREIRIETGYGNEGALPDHVCGHIIREILAPKCKVGQFEEGTSAAIDALLSRLGYATSMAKLPSTVLDIFDAIFFGFFLLLFIVFLFIRRKKPNDTFSSSNYPPSSHNSSWWKGGGSGSFGGGGFGGGRGGGGGASGRF